MSSLCRAIRLWKELTVIVFVGLAHGPLNFQTNPCLINTRKESKTGNRRNIKKNGFLLNPNWIYKSNFLLMAVIIISNLITRLKKGLMWFFLYVKILFRHFN